jgi:hypothetical protein
VTGSFMVDLDRTWLGIAASIALSQISVATKCPPTSTEPFVQRGSFHRRRRAPTLRRTAPAS